MGLNYEIVPASLAVSAMRDSGYKNAAYAIAELVDNAIQADSKLVEILCEENEEVITARTRRRLKHIAIVDDGKGMDNETLRKALQFGNGERLQDRSGIGRFGMGLPNSSISQSKKVEVWSWQDGVANAIYTYLDINEIASGNLNNVPAPVRKDLPSLWLKRSSTISTSKSGTFVLWSELDKCTWKTAQSIFKNSELIIGRIYRKFIANGRARIRMADFLAGSFKPDTNNFVVQNDPLYLIPNETLGEPWNKEPMFELFSTPHIFTFQKGAKKYDIEITISVAKNAARDGYNAGDQPHGKHAKSNVGVSVMRADRELELQIGWCNQHDTRERWWGIEVSFPPALDEVFGVTNNKQNASALAEYAIFDQEQIAEREGFATASELREAWDEDGDPRLLLLNIQQFIKNQLSQIRKAIEAQAKQRPKVKRHDDPNTAEAKATTATKERQDEGFKGTSDIGEKLPPNDRINQITTDLTDLGVPQESALDTANNVVTSQQKYQFYKVALESAEFFTVRPSGGTILIGLNTTHPAYSKLVTLLETSEDETIEQLRGRLNRSYEGLKLLLEAWARYEDELSDGIQKERAQDARAAWGRVARQFLRED